MSTTLFTAMRLRLLAGPFLLALLATCSPDYKSGVTACAATSPRCPDGFECRGIRCFAIGSPGGDSSGGSSGAGGAPAMGGRGGSAPSMGGNTGMSGMAGSTPGTAGNPGTAGRGGSAPAMGGTPGMAGRGGSSPPPMGGSPGTPGTGGAPASFPPAAMCRSFMADDNCDRCQYSLCCNELVACIGDQTCPVAGQCVAACADGDNACVRQCGAANMTGFNLFAALVTCGGMKCAQACADPAPTPPPGGGAPMPPPGGGTPMPPPGGGGGQAIGKFCNGLVMGQTDITIDLFLGNLKLSASSGRCSMVGNMECGPIPTGQVQARMEFNGQILVSDTFNIAAGGGYIFHSRPEAGRATLASIVLDNPAVCGDTLPPNPTGDYYRLTPPSHAAAAAESGLLPKNFTSDSSKVREVLRSLRTTPPSRFDSPHL